MKGKISFLPILLFLIILASCKKEPEFDNDLWMGTVRVIDHNIPFPFLIERTPKSLQLIDHRNQVIDSTSEPAAQYNAMDTITMQDHQFLVVKSSPNFLLFDTQDSLNFPYKHPLYSAQFLKTEEL